MFKFIKNLFKRKPKVKDDRMTVTESQKQYYEDLQRGYHLLQFIRNDIQRMKKQQVNRKQRRRLEKQLDEGKFSKELVDRYGQKIEEMCQFINNQKIISDKQAELNKKKAMKEAEKKRKEAEKKPIKAKPVDGAKFYEDAKKAEAKKK